jgi:AcrR family transcriptional regulator
MIDRRSIWIKLGYELFAQTGAAGIKVEALARIVGKSKSSFYHHFADVDLFMDDLLQFHLQQAHAIAQKERNAQCIDPELIMILIEHQTDLLFNRQLRIHRNNKRFAEILEQSNQIVGHTFVALWVRDLNLKLSTQQLEGIFELALENFYLQINPETMNYAWLSAYFGNLKRIVKRFS